MADLCTLANVKLALFPTGYTDTTDDSTLQLYISAITAEVQEYTGRQFIVDTAATDYYFDIGFACRSLYIPQGISTLNTVGYAKTSQPASGGTYTTITAANLLLRPLIGERRAGFPPDTIVISDVDSTYFYPGYNTVKVNAILGFTSVPLEIERLAVAIVVRRWQARKGGQTDTIGAEYGGTVLRFTSPEERSILDRYVDVAVG
jgi:hypothetical protein